jgi:hypothetical protein
VLRTLDFLPDVKRIGAPGVVPGCVLFRGPKFRQRIVISDRGRLRYEARAVFFAIHSDDLRAASTAPDTSEIGPTESVFAK